MQLHVLSSSHGEDRMDGHELGNQCKGVEIVDTWYLGEPLGNEVGLVSDDVACGILLGLEDPFVPNNVGFSWGLDKLPGSCFLECFKFIMDGFLP